MLILYLLVLCASALAHVRPSPDLYDLEDAENIFEKFINKYNKVYANEQEKQERFNIFKNNLAVVNRLHLEQPEVSFDTHRGSDLTKAEIASRYLGFVRDSSAPHVEPEKITVRDDLPDNFDWREHGAVGPVKNQHHCGACWAFSTTGGIEGAYAIKHKKLLSLSEQQIVACDKTDSACRGGDYTTALQYLQGAGGIETESDYPYEDQNGTCKFDKSKVVAQITGLKTIQFGNDDETKQALIDNGPISISVYASSAPFFYYNGSGVLQCPSGTQNDIDHAVLLVGYGIETSEKGKGVPYWLIKNSWGVYRGTGNRGYWKVQQGNNPCGMDYNPGVVPQVA